MEINGIDNIPNDTKSIKIWCNTSVIYILTCYSWWITKIYLFFKEYKVSGYRRYKLFHFLKHLHQWYQNHWQIWLISRYYKEFS